MPAEVQTGIFLIVAVGLFISWCDDDLAGSSHRTVGWFDRSETYSRGSEEFELGQQATLIMVLISLGLAGWTYFVGPVFD